MMKSHFKFKRTAVMDGISQPTSKQKKLIENYFFNLRAGRTPIMNAKREKRMEDKKAELIDSGQMINEQGEVTSQAIRPVTRDEFFKGNMEKAKEDFEKNIYIEELHGESLRDEETGELNTDDCWLWKAYSSGGGGSPNYGNHSAIRSAYAIYIKEIPEGVVIGKGYDDLGNPLCENKYCVNPHHSDTFDNERFYNELETGLGAIGKTPSIWMVSYKREAVNNSDYKVEVIKYTEFMCPVDLYDDLFKAGLIMPAKNAFGLICRRLRKKRNRYLDSLEQYFSTAATRADEVTGDMEFSTLGISNISDIRDYIYYIKDADIDISILDLYLQFADDEIIDGHNEAIEDQIMAKVESAADTYEGRLEICFGSLDKFVWKGLIKEMEDLKPEQVSRIFEVLSEYEMMLDS